VFTYIWTKSLKRIGPKMGLTGQSKLYHGRSPGWSRLAERGPTSDPGVLGTGESKVVDPAAPGQWRVPRQGTPTTALEPGSSGKDLGKSFFSRAGAAQVGTAWRGGDLQPWGSARLSRIKSQITWSACARSTALGRGVSWATPGGPFPQASWRLCTAK